MCEGFDPQWSGCERMRTALLLLNADVSKDETRRTYDLVFASERHTFSLKPACPNTQEEAPPASTVLMERDISKM